MNVWRLRLSNPWEEALRDQAELAVEIVRRSMRFFPEMEISPDGLCVSGRYLVGNMHLTPTRLCYASPNDICFCNFVPIYPAAPAASSFPFLDEVGYFVDWFGALIESTGARYVLTMDPGSSSFVVLYDLTTGLVVELGDAKEGLIVVILLTEIEYSLSFMSEVPE